MRCVFRDPLLHSTVVKCGYLHCSHLPVSFDHSGPSLLTSLINKLFLPMELLLSPAGGTGDIVCAEGRLDPTKYQEILKANVQRSVQTLKLKRCWVFRQDNDPKQNCCSPHWSEKQLNLLAMPACFYAFSCCQMNGWLNICINKLVQCSLGAFYRAMLCNENNEECQHALIEGIDVSFRSNWALYQSYSLILLCLTIILRGSQQLFQTEDTQSKQLGTAPVGFPESFRLTESSRFMPHLYIKCCFFHWERKMRTSCFLQYFKEDIQDAECFLSIKVKSAMTARRFWTIYLAVNQHPVVRKEQVIVT